MAEPRASALTRWTQAWAAWRVRELRRFWLGHALHVGGSWMQIVAMSWMAYRLAHSPFVLGLVQLIAALPVGLVSLLGGVLGDRLAPRTLLWGTQAVLVVQALVLAGLAWSGAVRLWHIMVMTFVVGAADALEQPARYVLAFQLAGPEGLSSAVGLCALAESVARALAPAVAGLLIRWQGEAGSYLLNGAAYGLACLVFLGLPALQDSTPQASTSLRADLLDGFRQVWQGATARGLWLLLALSCLLAQPYAVLVPVLARDVLRTDARGYGLLMSAIGAGAACGALIAAGIRPGRRGRWLIGSGLLSAALLLLSFVARRLPLNAGLLVLAGAGQTIQLVLIASLLQLAARREVHGRVASLFALLSNGLTRLGGLQAGWAASTWGAPLAVAGSALLSALGTLAVAWRAPGVWRLE